MAMTSTAPTTMPPAPVSSESPLRHTVADAAERAKWGSREDRIEFFQDLAADIELITGTPIVFSRILEAKLGDRLTFDDNLTYILEKLAKGEDEHQVLDQPHANTTRGLGISEIHARMGRVDGTYKENGEFTFLHLKVDHRIHELRMRDISYKCPDDFTRSIPAHAKRKLAVLQQTKFDYQPKILDGELTNDYVKISRRFVPILSEVVRDPAIAITICERKFAVDHWYEPYQSDLQRAWTSFHTSPKWAYSVLFPLWMVAIYALYLATSNITLSLAGGVMVILSLLIGMIMTVMTFGSNVLHKIIQAQSPRCPWKW